MWREFKQEQALKTKLHSTAVLSILDLKALVAQIQISTLIPLLFLLLGSYPCEQQDHCHPRQGLQPSDQAAAPVPVKELAKGHARQHAQEPAGASHPWERDHQN